MNLLTRSLFKSLVPTVLALTLIPVTCAWGQSAQESSTASTPPRVNTPADVSAATSGAQPAAERVEDAESGSGFSFLKVVGGLGLVLSLIVFGTFAVRKFAPQYFTKRASDRTLKLVETLSMGERRSIAVIEVEDRRLLIGNTPNQITLLALLGDGASFLSDHEVASAPVTSRTPGTSFKNLYEFEKNGQSRGKMKVIPPDIRAKMRQLRESLDK
jgi:flagellar biosynthetic protein FliO